MNKYLLQLRAPYPFVIVSSCSYPLPQNSILHSTSLQHYMRTFLLGACKDNAIGGLIHLTSSCEWRSGSNGFISVQSPFTKLPLSLVGISQSEVDAVKTNNIINTVVESNDYLTSRRITKPCVTKDQCKDFKMDTSNLNYLINYNVFQRSFYKEVTKMLPSSLSLEVNMLEPYIGAENIAALLGRGDTFMKEKYCTKVFFRKEDMYAVYRPRANNDIFFGEIRKGANNKDKQLCVAVNLVNKGIK